MTVATALRILAWVLFAGLVFVTLAPIELRPVSPVPTQTERGLALLAIGFVFALAYPRRLLLVAAIVLGSTVLLEGLQLVVATRHGGLRDVAVKLLGGSLGLACGWLVSRLLHRH